MKTLFVPVLNPHGSDETYSRDAKRAWDNDVLNPHGSDETLIVFQLLTRLDEVLNPHGSDETFLIFKKPHSRSPCS